MTGGSAAATPCIWSGSANRRDGQMMPRMPSVRPGGSPWPPSTTSRSERASCANRSRAPTMSLFQPCVTTSRSVTPGVGRERAGRGVVPVNAAVGPVQDLGAGESEEVGHGR